jgi:MFS family permease
MTGDGAVRSRLFGWLPERRASRRFLAVFFVDAVGTGLFLAGSALFFTRVVGLTSSQVGLGLSLSAVVGLLCAVPLGRLADRFGSRRMVIALYVWRGLGFVAYLFVNDVAGFFAVACFLGATQWAIGPIMQALVGDAEEGASRVRTMAAMNVVRNAGFVIGALLATLAIASGSADGYRSLVLGDAASFFVAGVLLARTPVIRRRRAAAQAPKPAVRVRDVRYIALAAANGVLFMHTVLLPVGLPLWISTRTDAPATLLGVVVVLNTVLAIALAVRLSRGVDGVAAGGARQHWAGWSLAACCVLVALTVGAGAATASVLLVGAAIALTLGELWQSIGSWSLSYAFAPEDQRAYYLTVYRLGEPCVAIAGPVALTFGVMGAGSTGWLCLAGVFVLAGTGVRAIAARAGRAEQQGGGAELRPRRVASVDGQA